jgi:hypothetical protein
MCIFFPNEFDYINLFDYLSIENPVKLNKKLTIFGQNSLSELGHLIKFNKTKWHVWSKWPMGFIQIGYPYMLINKLNWLIITLAKQVA